MYEVMQSCPRYERCNAPICPLDPEWEKRIYIEGEPVCKLDKAIRMKLGKDLPNIGLWPAELAAYRRWSKEDKDARSRIALEGAKYRKLKAVER